MSDLKAVQRRFVDEFQSSGKVETAQELLADDFVDHSAMPGVPGTRDGVMMLFAGMRGGIPDMTAEIHDMMQDGNKVITRKTLHGTHTGVLFGVPPTGRPVAIDVIDIVRIEDGQLREHWNIVDRLGMLQQLGVIPADG